jgi:hypothetical protein
MARTRNDEGSEPLFVTITRKYVTVSGIRRRIYLDKHLKGLERDAAALSFAASRSLLQADVPEKPRDVDEEFLRKLGRRLFSAVFKPPAIHKAYDDSEGEIALGMGSRRIA